MVVVFLDRSKPSKPSKPSRPVCRSDCSQLFYVKLWSQVEPSASSEHHQSIISASSVHHQRIISSSSAHNQNIINALLEHHQRIISASSVHHQCIISALSMHHQCIISASLAHHQNINVYSGISLDITKCFPDLDLDAKSGHHNAYTSDQTRLCKAHRRPPDFVLPDATTPPSLSPNTPLSPCLSCSRSGWR